MSNLEEREETAEIERDFIGYGKDIPMVKWPYESRLALTFAVNYEAGGERSTIYGDDGPET